jgi:hypothetical protein
MPAVGVLVHQPESLEAAVEQVRKGLGTHARYGLRAEWQPNLFGGPDDAIVYCRRGRVINATSDLLSVPLGMEEQGVQLL